MLGIFGNTARAKRAAEQLLGDEVSARLQEIRRQGEEADAQIRARLVAVFPTILQKYGPLPLTALCALYNADQHSDVTVREVQRWLSHDDTPAHFKLLADHSLVRLPEQQDTETLPAPKDYVVGYYDVLHVLKTIQANPALASTPMTMITDLYGLPSGRERLHD